MKYGQLEKFHPSRAERILVILPELFHAADAARGEVATALSFRMVPVLLYYDLIASCGTAAWTHCCVLVLPN